MKIIDAHVHTCFEDRPISKFAKQIGVEPSESGLLREMQVNKVDYVISITLTTENMKKSETPIRLDTIKKQVEKNKTIIGVGGINPLKVDKESVKKVEEALANGIIKGLKIYLGYFPSYPNNKRYTKFYKIAEKYEVPVIFHTGDTWSEERQAKLKYAHPINIDEVAVDFPNTTFILAHLGNPWTVDAAEVIYKNENVYADLSGLLIGNPLQRIQRERITEAIRWALDYVDDPNKFLYGSDWPLVKMENYIEFIKKIVPKKYYTKIFYTNAKKMFKIK